MKADNRYIFGGAYDQWKTSDPADDLPEKITMTDDLALDLATFMVADFPLEARHRLKEFYLNNEEAFHEDWEEYKSEH